MAAAVTLLPGARADVADAAAEGFGIALERTVPLTTDDAYRVFVEEVGTWWNGAHTYGGDARALTIDARPGGCFCERLEDGDEAGVEHLRVSVARPGRELRLLGGLGPLQPLGVHGAMSIRFEVIEASSTRVRLIYRVAGHAPDGLASWAEPVDGVLGDALDRYAAHASRPGQAR